MYDKSDYDEELKDIKNAGRFLANRDEVRIGFLNDPKLIRKFKKETSWFSRSGFNSFIVKRYDDKLFVNDMITSLELQQEYHLTLAFKEMLDNYPGKAMNRFSTYINRKSMKEIEAFHPQIYQVLKKSHQPLILIYVDFINSRGNDREASIRLINKVFPELTEQPHMIHKIYNVLYVDNNKYKHTRQSQEIFHDQTPAIAVNFYTSTAFSYPKDKPMTAESIMKWLKSTFESDTLMSKVPDHL